MVKNKIVSMRKKLETYLSDYKRQILQDAKILLDKPMPQLSEELFCQFELTGNRLEYENVYFERRRFLSVLAIAAEEVESYKLEQVLLNICEETCWALPAHVDRKREGWENTIDLFAAETAFYLAEISQKNRGQLSEETVQLVGKEVLRRVLIPFSKSKRPYASWEQCNMNWNAVCNGAIGCAALWLLAGGNSVEDTYSNCDGGEPTVKIILKGIIDRVIENLPHYLKGFSKDGVCLEGLSYYTYGLTFYFAFADLLKKFTGDDRGLLEDAHLNEIAVFLQKCYLPGGYTISFSDGNIRQKFCMGLQTFMAMNYDGVEILKVELAADPWDDACYRYVTMSRDVEWTRRYLEIGEDERSEVRTTAPEQMVYMFPEAQWAVIRRGDSAIAVKGGHNDEPHNHNDVGSVMYIADGNLLLTDLGAGEYTREYFGEGRYENICCSSLGHSVPIINGRGQQAGAEYKATKFERIVEEVVLNISGAYDLENGESVRRTVFFCQEDGSFGILDQFILLEGCTATENLVTPIRPVETEKGFLLEIGGHQYAVTCNALSEKRVVERTYRNHAGEEDTVWMMQWDVKERMVKVVIREDCNALLQDM